MQRPHISRNLAWDYTPCFVTFIAILLLLYVTWFDEKRNWRPCKFLKYYYFLQTGKFIFILPAKPKIEGKRAYLKRHMQLLLNSLSKSLTNLLMII